jgi:hypothetical protein
MYFILLIQRLNSLLIGTLHGALGDDVKLTVGYSKDISVNPLSRRVFSLKWVYMVYLSPL